MTPHDHKPVHVGGEADSLDAVLVQGGGEIDTTIRPRSPDTFLPGEEPRYRPENKHLPHGNDLTPGPYHPELKNIEDLKKEGPSPA